MNDATTINRPHSDERPTAPEGMTYSRKGVLVKRRKQVARSNKVFLVMQVIDHNGEVIDNLGKKNVRIITTERNSDKVLEMIDNGEHEGAFYVRVDLATK